MANLPRKDFNMARMTGKTRQMLRWEERQGERLEDAIRRLYQQGMSGSEMAKSLGVSPSTFYLWMARLRPSYRIEFDTEQPVG